jgi:hypothetical protein
MKADVWEVQCESVNWIDLAEGEVLRQAVLNMAMKLWLHESWEIS